MDDATDISVVICAYSDRRWDRLRAAIDSISAQHTQALELIVVADHNPGLQARLLDTYPHVRTLPNAGRRGLSAARNTGVREANGAVIAFLDDDAVAPHDWLTQMTAWYADRQIIGVGGRVVPVWPDGQPPWFPDEFGWVVGCSYRGQPERISPVRNLIGTNMSFRRTVFDKLGGFREALGRQGADGSGCEETELCIRIRQAYGHSALLYDPGMVIHHHLDSGRDTWRYFRTRCWAEGRSKALVAAERGAPDALSVERRYATRTLPRGVLRGLRDSITKLDRGGLARSGAILTGFACTAAGYLAAKQAAKRNETPEPPFSPIQILDVDLGNSRATDSSPGKGYTKAFCLLRFDGRPIGTAEVELNEGRLPSDLERYMAPIRPHATASSATADGRQEAPFISVIIATRDRADKLAKCLDSVLGMDYPNFDVIVVDNAPSSEETAELIAGRYTAGGRVRYVRENEPGLGRAHNAGLAKTQAPFVAFTDDDVVVDPNWLGMIASNFSRDETVACVTGLILPAEIETRAQYWAERHGGFGKGFERRVFDSQANRPRGRLYPFTAGQLGSGANMAFRTDVLKAIGGFDPALGAGTRARGGDDLAAFFKIIEANYRLIYEPGAVVWHYHRRDEAGMRRQALGYGIGLGAYLTKLVVDRPALLLKLAVAAPAGLAHVFGPSSPKNQRIAADYPRSFVWRERCGIVAGIPLYLLSRHAARHTAAVLPVGGSPVPSPALD